jgi:outer membrane protein assembly factor BamB
MRRDLFYAIILITLLGGCATVSDWYDSLFSQGREKAAPLPKFNASAKARVLWKVDAGSSGGYVFAPYYDGQALYAAGKRGEITKLDPANGRLRWRLDAKRTLSAGVGGGEALVLVGTPKGEILAFDQSGELRWSAFVSSEVLSPPQVADGVVVVRSGDGRIFGLDATSGKQKWVYQRATPALTVRSNAQVAIYQGAVFAGFAGGKLVALSLANGGLGWEGTVAQPKGATELERVADITSAPVVDDRQVCAVAFQGRVACFDPAKGTLLWARDVSSVTGLTMDSRNVYVASDESVVLALDKVTGATLWKQDKLHLRRVTAPLAYGPYVAVADFEGYVHFLNRGDGSFAARVATDGKSIATRAILLDEDLLVQTRGGGVYALTAR